VSINYIAKWTGGNYVDTCGNNSSINEIINKENSFLVFPNPSNGNYTLQYTGNGNGIAEFSIFNILSEEVYSAKLKTTVGINYKNIDLSGFSQGMYTFKIIVNNTIINKKVIVY